MPSDKLRQAVALFNQRNYFGAHELLEELWRQVPEEDQPLYEAMIRIATALHLRFNRGGQRGSLNLLQQALVRLEDLRPACGDINTAALYDDVSAYVERLTSDLGPATWFERFRVPKIQVMTGRTSTP